MQLGSIPDTPNVFVLARLASASHMIPLIPKSSSVMVPSPLSISAACAEELKRTIAIIKIKISS